MRFVNRNRTLSAGACAHCFHNKLGVTKRKHHRTIFLDLCGLDCGTTSLSPQKLDAMKIGQVTHYRKQHDTVKHGLEKFVHN